MRTNLKTFKRESSKGSALSKRPTLRSSILFGLIIISTFNLSAQCSVSDLSLEDQKKILSKFARLDACDSAQIIDSLQINSLRADKHKLQSENIQLTAEIKDLNDVLNRRKKWPWISGLSGLIIGWVTRGGAK